MKSKPAARLARAEPIKTPLANNNPADRNPSPSTGGDGAAGASGPKGFGTGA